MTCGRKAADDILGFGIADEDGECTTVRVSRLRLVVGAQLLRDDREFVVTRRIGQCNIGHGVFPFRMVTMTV